MAPQRPSDRATPTADAPPRIGLGGAVLCRTCGYGCVCDDRSSTTSSNTSGSASSAVAPWGERGTPMLLPMIEGGGPLAAGLAVFGRPVTPLHSAVPPEHLHLMALFLYLRPDASPDAVRAYLYRRTGGARLYRREEILDAIYPFSRRNIRRWVFVTQPPPLGVAFVRRRRLLDVAEFGIALVKAAPTTAAASLRPNDKDDGTGSIGGGNSDRSPEDYGTYDTLLVQKPWCYGPSTAFVVFLGVEAGDPSVPDPVPGSVARPRLWFHLTKRPLIEGRGAFSLANFVLFICRCLHEHPAPGGKDHRRVITWDDHPTRSLAPIFDAVRSTTTTNAASKAVTNEGSPPGLDGTPLVGVPRPLSHPGRGPAKRCLLDAIDAIVRRLRNAPSATETSCMGPEEWIRNLQHVLSTDLSWDGNALNWFDQYPDD